MAANKQWGRATFIINMIVPALFFPGLVLLLAGDWRWLEGWLLGLWLAAMIISNVAYLYLKNPALLAERAKPVGSDNQKSWDKLVQGFAYIMAIAWLVLIPLDARRFGWSPAFPVWLKVVGGIMLLPAIFFIYRATADNNFLSAMVRIQDERKQTVVTTGVYSFVRHPLYLGVLLMLAGTPLLAGSLIGLGISLIAALVLFFRILGEEKMLLEELDGYAEYKQKTRYRLLPFVW